MDAVAENTDLIAEALDLSADEADAGARQARVDALLARGGPNVLMLAIGMTHARAAASRRLGADLLAGLAGDPRDRQASAAAQGRLVEMIATEGDPGVMRVVIAALGASIADDAGPTPG